MFYLFIGLVYLSLLVHAKQQKPSSSSFSTFFSFGDSYTTQYLDLSTLTYPDPKKTSSTNGFNWVHYFTQAEKLVNWNLAYNSAPIKNELVDQDPKVIDVDQQITGLFPRYFLKNGTNSYDPNKTLYGIWVGINDAGFVFQNKTLSLDPLMDRYLALIDFLYKNNARHFLLVNIPPIERSPKWRPKPTGARMQELVKNFNQRILDMTHIVAKYDGAKVYPVDAWSIYTHILDHPEESGFKNTEGFCPQWREPEKNGCLPIENYFWLNRLHPTTKVHSLFADQVQKVLSQ